MQNAKDLNRSRYGVLALLFLGWLLGNIDRLTMNYAIVDITKEFNLNSSATGLILSSFFLGYALMQIPGGWLADKFGAKKTLLIIITVWSFFTGLTGFAGTLAFMIVFRFAFGLSEGGFYPSGARMITQSFPLNDRSKALSVLLSSGAIAALIVPVFATSMMLNVGWRMLFIIIGLMGAAVAVLFWIFLKDPNGNQTKEPSNLASDNNALQPSVSFKQILKEPLIWFLFIAYFGAYTIQWGVAAWIPTYLVNVRHLNLSTLGWVSVIPAIAALLGMFFTGFITDKLPQGRDRLLAVFGMAGVAVLLLLMYEAPNLTMYVVYASLQMFCISIVGLMLPTIPLKYMPSEIVGKTSGFMNTGGQLAGFITPLVIGFIIDAFGGSFLAAFLYMIIFAIICIIAMLSMRLKSIEKNIEERVINS